MTGSARAASGAGVDLMSGDLLVVRTALGWNLTLADRREPTPISDAALHGAVRVSGGALLPADDPGRAELIAAGVDLPVDAHAVAVAASGSGPEVASARGEEEWVPVHPMINIESIPVFVARVVAGSLLIEGDGGRRQLLDEIDLFLLESLEVGGTVGQVTEAVRVRLGAGAPSDHELSGRLRQIGEVGRLQLLTGPAVAGLPADPPAEAPVAYEEPEPVAAVSLGLKGELRRLSFPGRQYAAEAYRVLRRARRAARPGAPKPVDLDEVTDDADLAPTDSAEATPVDAASVALADNAAAPDAEVAPEPEAVPFDASGQVKYLGAPYPWTPPEDAIPVYSVFPVETGPPLSLGMLLAAARAHGDLNEQFELRRVEDPASFFSDMARRPGPAILLLSHYVWSVDHNLELARRARAANPELVIIHGGPSAPKYEAACEDWFEEHRSIADVNVRGEGEVTLVEALSALAASESGLDLARLEAVEGLTFRHPDGRVVRTPDRDRIVDLNALPSPYLTGEFDHIDPSAWTEVTLESNRGCPYGCTFCDWGSSTLSRIRKFDIDRVAAEMHWAGERQFNAWAMGDANFGIMSRDVEVTQRVTEVRERWGYPKFVGFNVAKNTTKHLIAIVDEMVRAGIAPMFTLALQTRDEDTLEAVKRSNISSDHYTRLASSLRRRGLPLRADIMLGLPGQTPDSLAGDLQFLIDHEVPARMWITQLLPNAPINDPEYRKEWEVEDDHGVVVATKSFTREDRAEMILMRHAYTVFEQFGLLRHVTRHVQWDHDLAILDVLRRVVKVSSDDPGRYPLLNWTMRYFDYFNAPPVGWRSFYDEVRRFLVAEFGVPLTPALDVVLELQELLMPELGRTFPATIALRHDYATYYKERTRPLWTTEPAATAGPKLAEYGPARFTVYADPLTRCGVGTINVISDPRNESMTEDFWMYGHWEMDSPLVVNQPQVAGSQRFIGLLEQVPDDLPDDLPDEPEPTSRSSVRVSLARSSATAADTHDDQPD